MTSSMTQNDSALAILDEKHLLLMNPDDIVILVMGVTGSGKSSFVQLFVDEDVGVGHDLEPCTVHVGIYVYRNQDGQNVYLIDTPGFNDAKKTDAEILKEISLALVAMRQRGIAITGIAYLHNIMDKKMSGSNERALKAFKAMCGEHSYPHVTLVANMASHHSSSRAEDQKIRQLEDRKDWWGDMVTCGSRIIKHTGTAESAKKILEPLIAARDKTLVLTIQKELVDDGLDLDNTSAGQQLGKEIREAVEQLRARMKGLQEEARKTHDADKQRALDEQKNKLQKEIDQALESQESLRISVKKLAEEKAEQERKRLDDLAKWEKLRDELEAQQKQNQDVNLEEIRRLLQELEKRPHQSDMDRLEEMMKDMENRHREERAKDQEALRDRDERAQKQASNGTGWKVFRAAVGITTLAIGVLTMSPDLAIHGAGLAGGGFS